ncbi:MAG: cadherin-like domain-containing protein, partial [Phycisphaerae bacterium]
VVDAVNDADTYYVADPRGADGLAGTADDVDSSDSYPGTMAQPFATLARAAAAAALGDTVLIRGGTYNEQLVPQHSGGPGEYITFQNYGDEVVTITGASLDPAINISNRSYVAIRGLNVANVNRWLWALDAHHNIIEGNHFSHAINPGASSKGGLFFQEATYNKIIDNVIDDNTSDNLALHASDYNLIQGNTITRAGHTLWTIKGGDFNVLRDNYFHNEWQKIGEVYDPWGAGFDHELYEYNTTKHNLITNNVFAYTPSSGDHSPFAGIQYAGQDGIIRQNLFYEMVGPGLDLTLYGEEATYNTGNRIYNNVFSRTEFAGISLSGATGYAFSDNVFKNNALSNSVFVANDTRWSWYTQELDGQPVQLLTGRLDGFLFEGNGFVGAQGVDEPYLVTYGSRDSSSNPPQQTVAWWEANHPELFAGNMSADPQFVDEVGHDFHLRPGSSMVDAGTFLTTTVGSGTGTSVTVEDASYFYDGYGIGGEAGDTIQLEGQSVTATVVDIDYENNILILDQPVSWADGQGVGLSYSGDAPDIGAFEYEGAAPDNTAPTASDDSASAQEDIALTFDPQQLTANDTDVDGDALTVTGFTQPSHGTLVDNGDGTWTYTSDGDYFGQDSFTYTVSDGNGGSAEGTVTLTVEAVNDAPSAGDDSATTNEDIPVNIDVLDNDTDVESVSLSIAGFTQGSHGVVTSNGDGTL